MKPHTSYLICGIQRSGSFLLREALKNTGLAGVPEEYFLEGEYQDGGWARQHGVTTFREFLRLVIEKGTTDNGVFGAKIQQNEFPGLMTRLRELPEYADLSDAQVLLALFPNVHYILITRRDTLRQAISWARAAQTGVFALKTGTLPIPKQAPVFDFEKIDSLRRLVLEGEAQWQDSFRKRGIEPFRVVYEELVEEYESTALRILDYLGVGYPNELAFGERQLQQQADESNELWAQQFLELSERGNE